MPSALASTEIVIGALALLTVIVVGFVYLRRRLIAGGQQLTLCAVRCPGTSGWRVGLARLGDNALEWFSLGGVSLRPRHRWQRQTLLLGTPHRLEAHVVQLLPGAYAVDCTSGDEVFELALQVPDYTAVRSWQEAAPPGFGVNVA